MLTLEEVSAEESESEESEMDEDLWAALHDDGDAVGDDDPDNELGDDFVVQAEREVGA